MKKTLFYMMALGAVALTACTEEAPEPESKASDYDYISFRSGMSSRAEETTNSNLNSIYVTAFAGDSLYFENLNFQKGADTFFTSTPSYEWLGDTGLQYKFFAYAPSQDELGADITTGSADGKTAEAIKLENFTVASEIADQVDFVTAEATGNRNDNESAGVELTFDHRLAQIELQAKSENPTYDFKVTGARIGRPQITGSFDFLTNEWTIDEWHETDVFTTSCDEVTLGATPVSIMGKSGNAMLIPQTLVPWSPSGDPDNVAREAYLSVLVRITTKADGHVVYPFPSDTRNVEYAWASIPLSGTWEQGKKYVYILDFTEGAGNIDPDDPQPGNPVLGGPIKFTVDVSDWTNSDIPTPMTPDLKGGSGK
ncbi:MAG: fimbrillin family protein [Bacteroidales bacterium]|nr:fimbrillin family protein [Bacteroidales bacterium]